METRDVKSKIAADLVPKNISDHIFTSAKHIDVECVTHLQLTMEIVVVTEGTLQMIIGGKEYSISKGNAVFIPPFESHMFHSAEPNQCLVLIFSKELVPFFFDFLKNSAPSHHLFSISDISMSILDTHLPLDENKINYICAQAILAPICYEITQKCEFTLRSRPLEDVMSSVLAYMNSHFTEDLTLESVAHATALHPVTLSKMFSKRAGINFNFYLQYLRSSYAASLIKAEDLTFTEIAYMAGFGCIRSFNRAFVNIYGITPTEYRLSSSV